MINYEKAIEKYKIKDYEEAINYFDKYIKSNSTSSKELLDSFVKKSICHRFEKDYEKAENIINEGFKLFPNNDLLNIELATLRNRQERWSEAVVLWENIKKHSSEFSELNYERYIQALDNLNDRYKTRNIVYEAYRKFSSNSDIDFYRKKYKFNIAVQFFGHSRSFKDTFPTFKKYILDSNDSKFVNIDIFIHTWSEKEHSTIKPHYKKDIEYAGKPLLDEDIEFIKNNYNPKGFLVEEQLKVTKDEEDSLKSRNLSVDAYRLRKNVSYTIFKANELRQKSEIEYDIVLLSRLDIVFYKPLLFNDFYENGRVLQFMAFNKQEEFENVIFYPYMNGPNTIRNQNKYITGIDLLCIGSPNVMNKMTSWHIDILNKNPLGTEAALTNILYYSKPECWTILRTNSDELKSNNSYIDKKILDLKNNWEFDNLDIYYASLIKSNQEYLVDYIILLGDNGKLDKLAEIYKLYRNELEDLKNDVNFNHPRKSIISHLYNFVYEKYHKVNIDSTDSHRLMYLTKYASIEELIDYISKSSETIFDLNSDGYHNMILNFTINRVFLENKYLKIIVFENIIKLYIKNNKINEVRKRYVLNKVIKYIIENNSDILEFVGKNREAIRFIMSFLQKFIKNEIGAKKLYRTLQDSFYYKNFKMNNLLIKKEPKIAICISGMFRISDEVLKIINKNIAKPLKADIFLHTWNKYEKWHGVEHSGDDWTIRVGLSHLKNSISKELHSFKFIKDNFENFAIKINDRVYEDFNLDFISDELKFKRFKIEDEEDLINSLGENIDKFKVGGKLNQIKMFYGIYASHKLAVEYENKNGFKYDYIIRARPDVALIDKLSFENLVNLEVDEVAVDFYEYGPQDQFFYSSRENMIKIASIFEKMKENCRLNIFDNLENLFSHNLMLSWFTYNKLYPTNSNMRRNIGYLSKTAVPNGIWEELEKDFVINPSLEKYRKDFELLFPKNKTYTNAGI